jgi:hypothetical protein
MEERRCGAGPGGNAASPVASSRRNGEPPAISSSGGWASMLRPARVPPDSARRPTRRAHEMRVRVDWTAQPHAQRSHGWRRHSFDPQRTVVELPQTNYGENAPPRGRSAPLTSCALFGSIGSVQSANRGPVSEIVNGGPARDRRPQSAETSPTVSVWWPWQAPCLCDTRDRSVCAAVVEPAPQRPEARPPYRAQPIRGSQVGFEGLVRARFAVGGAGGAEHTARTPTHTNMPPSPHPSPPQRWRARSAAGAALGAATAPSASRRGATPPG